MHSLILYNIVNIFIRKLVINIKYILHIDLNAFYASVEIKENPNLKNKAVAVAGDEATRGGVILTANYEARKYGVKAGMSNRDALKLCPGLTMVKPRHSLYKKYSNKMINLLREYTYKLEQFSIDEAWIDISDIAYNKDTALNIAYDIKNRIKREIGVTVSIGVSYCKILSKLASSVADRDSVFLIDYNNLKTDVWKMPAKELMGVGAKTCEKLKAINIYTIADLALADVTLLKTLLKKQGEQLWKYANGLDNSKVNYKSSFPKSIGNSHTVIKDIESMEDAKKILLLISMQVGERLRRYKATASVISIVVKTNDFKSFTRQKTLQSGTCTTNRIYTECCKLLEEHWNGKTPIRLIGISLGKIKYYEEQISFDSLLNGFEYKNEILDYAIDEINRKYSKPVITRALIIEESKIYNLFKSD